MVLVEGQEAELRDALQAMPDWVMSKEEMSSLDLHQDDCQRLSTVPASLTSNVI
jgi:hypothetical protein